MFYDGADDCLIRLHKSSDKYYSDNRNTNIIYLRLILVTVTV